MQPCPKIDEAVTQIDRTWFALHPSRTARVRHLVPGELLPVSAAGDGVQAVAVRQLRPGVRVRLPVYLPRLPPDTEEAAMAVVQRAMGVRG